MLLGIVFFGFITFKENKGYYNLKIDNELITQIDFSGNGLLMEEQDLLDQIGEGEPHGGCFGCSTYAYYPNQNFIIAVSDGTGNIKNKVVKIQTEDTRYNLLGIKVGSSLHEAINILEDRGFKRANENDYLYSKDDLYIQLWDKQNKVKKLAVEIRGRTKRNIQR